MHVIAQHDIFGTNFFVWNNEIWWANITKNYWKTHRFSSTILAKTFTKTFTYTTRLHNQFEMKLGLISWKLKKNRIFTGFFLELHTSFFLSRFLLYFYFCVNFRIFRNQTSFLSFGQFFFIATYMIEKIFVKQMSSNWIFSIDWNNKNKQKKINF